ncbi:MAG: SMC family ATPase [Thermoplasmata archaeon]|nr:SMC family ATPase [Thermoplasmata archaeon]
MQLRRLTLRNLRSYTNAQLEFGPGTTLVAGDVGSGKTSLLYAVEMALFGFAEVDDAAHLVRHLADEAEVGLTLEDGEHTYGLRRKFVRRHRKGREMFEAVENSYQKDGARTQYSATELRQRAIDLLGFPDNPNPRSHSDLWRWAVYIPQEKMREVLDQEPEERLEAVRKALGLEQFRTAADNAQEVAGELRKRSEIKAAEAERLTHYTNDVAVQTERLEAMTRSLHEARRVEEDRRAATVELDRRLSALQQALRQVEADHREADEIAAQRSEIERGRREREVRRADRSRTLERIAEDARVAQSESAREPGLRTRLDTALQAVARAREELESKREQTAALAVAQSRASDLDRQLAEVERHRTSASADVLRLAQELQRLDQEGPARGPVAPGPEDTAALEVRLGRIQAEVDHLRGEAARLEHEREELSSLVEAGVCPRCHQAVSSQEFLRHSAEAEAAVRDAKAPLGAAVAERDRLVEARGARERYEREHERWVQMEHHREAVRTEVGSAEHRSQGAAAERASLLLERSGLADRLSELAPLGEQVEELKRRLVEADEHSTSIRTELEAVARSSERWVAAEAGARMVAEEIERLRAEDELAMRRDSELRGRRDALSPRIAGATALADSERALTREREEARRQLDSAVGEIARSAQQLEESRRRLSEAERGAAERSELLAGSEHTRMLASWFSGAFREGALRLERQMLGQAHREFERSFARYFGTLIEDASLVARLDPHFAPYVEVDGEWTPPAALSGGERTALALAYRLALGGVVRSAGRLKLTTLILDEPTDGFSPEQVIRMGELLEELGLPQVILVSHEAGLSAVADRVIRVRKSGGVSVLDDEPRPGDPRRPALEPEVARASSRRRRTARLDEPAEPGRIS